MKFYDRNYNWLMEIVIPEVESTVSIIYDLRIPRVSCFHGHGNFQNLDVRDVALSF